MNPVMTPFFSCHTVAGFYAWRSMIESLQCLYPQRKEMQRSFSGFPSNPGDLVKWRGKNVFHPLVVAPSTGLEGDDSQLQSYSHPPSPAPFLLSLPGGIGLSPAALDIWSVSARRPPPQKPLLSSAPCVSTFLWTNTVLNNSVCSASTCPGTAVQTRLPGWDVWYPNPSLKKETLRARDQLTTVFSWITLTDYFNIYFFMFCLSWSQFLSN